VPSPLQNLIHSSLGIHSLLKRQPLKHNVIDRDKVILPPNWDSWGKIRVLREGFDVEGVNQGWSIDIEEQAETMTETNGNETEGQDASHEQTDGAQDGALGIYEETIRNPGLDVLAVSSGPTNSKKLDVKGLDAQAFLASQLEVLERLRHEADPTGTDNKRIGSNRTPSQSRTDAAEESNYIEEGRVNEHIGPVQFNMGGIQVDADDMLQRLKVIDR
jgi:dynein light intermediate chain 1